MMKVVQCRKLWSSGQVHAKAYTGDAKT